jgi:hypothetical protein
MCCLGGTKILSLCLGISREGSCCQEQPTLSAQAGAVANTALRRSAQHIYVVWGHMRANIGLFGVQVAWNKAELSAHDMEPEQQERLFSGRYIIACAPYSATPSSKNMEWNTSHMGRQN